MNPNEFNNIVKIGNTEFYVVDEEYNAFTAEYYRVYYIDSRNILSVETPEPKN